MLTRKQSREHVVSFRVSEAEYADLVATCRATGANSVSDLARITTCDVIFRSAQPDSGGVILCLRVLDQSIQDLKWAVNQLRNEIQIQRLATAERSRRRARRSESKPAPIDARSREDRNSGLGAERAQGFAASDKGPSS